MDFRRNGNTIPSAGVLAGAVTIITSLPVEKADRPTIHPVSTPAIPEKEWIAEFEAAARRPLPQRMRYAFIRTYKPVLDDAPFRAFETMAEYRAWCEANLPSWLGYGR